MRPTLSSTHTNPPSHRQVQNWAEPILSLDDVTHDFGSHRALDGLSLQIQPGQITGLLGPNGAGKTTAIRLILGLLTPTSGTVRVFGVDPATGGTRVRASIGSVLDDAGLYDRLTASQNLEFFARAWNLHPDDTSHRIAHLLHTLDLHERRHDEVGGWSSGMRRRLTLARALLPDPPLLLLDEPTKGLDISGAATFREHLERLVSDRSVTVLLATHNLQEAERLTHKIAVLNHGRLASLCRSDELREAASAHHLRVILSDPPLPDAHINALEQDFHLNVTETEGGHLELRSDVPTETPRILEYLVHRGVQVEEVTKPRATLEEALLQLLEEDEDEEEEEEEDEEEDY